MAPPVTLIDIFLSKAPFQFKFNKKRKQYAANLVNNNLAALTEAANSSTNMFMSLQRNVFGCYYCEQQEAGEAFEIVDPDFHDDEEPLDVLIQPLLQDISLDRRRSQGLQGLYHLVDFQHKDNRIPLVCRRTDPPALKTVNVLASSCLMQESLSSPDRRWACLIINNLAIPLENKAALVSNCTLMDALLFVISNNFPETHLCCVCLMNLSYTENASVPIHKVMLQYQMTLPSSDTNSSNINNDDDNVPLSVILENPRSLLRILETMMKDYTQILIGNLAKTYSSRSLVSVQGEAVRWTVGWMRNVTVAYSCCQWLCQTRLPYDMIQVFHKEITTTATTTVSSSPANVASPPLVEALPNADASSPTGASTSFVSKWTRDSLPDLALGVLLNLVQYSDCCELLLERSGPLLADSLEPIVDQGGIHDMRASMILCRLEQHQHPNGKPPSNETSNAWSFTKKLFQNSS